MLCCAADSGLRRCGQQRTQAKEAHEHRDDDQGRTGGALQPPVEAVRRRHRAHRGVAVARARGRARLVLQPAPEGEANDGPGRRAAGGLRRAPAAARRRPVLRRGDVLSSRVDHVHVLRGRRLHAHRRRQRASETAAAAPLIVRQFKLERCMQPVATCRQSPYLHQLAIIIMTSFSL